MTGMFLINVLLALAWVFVTGAFNLVNGLFGFLLGLGTLYLIREQIGTIGYVRRVRRLTALAGLFLYELLMSAIRVFGLVLTPDLSKLQPGFVAFPLTVDRDFEIALLANLITLTPGTLSVDVSDNRRTLYIHAIHVPDPQALCEDIATGFERKIMEAFR
ncbi:MAG: Na+/H+ antiporter subunit E [Devosiaceae bacterium]|nr:Na+/H+ antiporter subunit E [Devosiaceae bacterium MH13]